MMVLIDLTSEMVLQYFVEYNIVAVAGVRMLLGFLYASGSIDGTLWMFKNGIGLDKYDWAKIDLCYMGSVVARDN